MLQEKAILQLTDSDWQALWLTVQLAAATTAILMALCLPLAWKLARWQSPLKLLIETITTLPLILPPTVIGYYLLLAFSPNYFIGQWFGVLFNQQLAFSFEGILIASIIYSLPFALKPLQAAFEQQGQTLSESAALLGFSPLQTFFHILLPSIRPALLGAITLTFAHTVGEFGVILMIGGNIEGLTQVASVALFDHVENLEYSAANSLALVLLIFSCAVVLLSQWLSRQQNKQTIGPQSC